MPASTLTPEELAQLRQWINSQGYGQGVTNVTNGQQVAPTGGFNFDNGDFLDFLKFDGAQSGNTGGAAADVLGAAIAAGYSDPATLAQITGAPVSDVQAYIDSFSPQARNHLSTQGALNLGYITPDEYQGFNRESSVYNDAPDYGAVGYSGGANGSLFLDPSWQSSFDTTGTTDNTGGGGGGRRGPRGYGQQGGAGGMGWTGNPYVSQMGDALSDQWTKTLTEQWLPSIRDSSVAAGGLGGSRAGVAQGMAVGRAGEGLANSLSGLYGGMYESEANRGLQKYGIDTNAALGWGGLDNQAQSIENQWNLGNQSMDLSRIGLGSQLLNQSYTLPWYGIGQMGNLLGTAGAQNTTINTGGQTGGGWSGALGGLLAGGQLGKNFGWF